MTFLDQLKDDFSKLFKKAGINFSDIYSRKYLFPASVILLVLFVLVLIFRSPSEELEPSIEFGELPDFSAYTDINQMKADFFDYLHPMVDYHNSRIMAQREQLQSIYRKLASGERWHSDDQNFVTSLANQYNFELLEGWDSDISENLDDHTFNQVYRRLLLRVDEIPVDLALVQAAKESGWGRSRFAVAANNLFGQWCYVEGCGIVPERRSEGANHEVQKFASISDAIAGYMNNLNSHNSYDTLRLIRGGLRSAMKPVTGMALADGLIYYSERREAYVEELKTMIYQFHNFQNSRQVDVDN